VLTGPIPSALRRDSRQFAAVSSIGPTITFTFYTYSALHQERIIRHTDVYAPSECQFETEQQVVATGRGGFVF